jgi:hypothetical protein
LEPKRPTVALDVAALLNADVGISDANYFLLFAQPRPFYILTSNSQDVVGMATAPPPKISSKFPDPPPRSSGWRLSIFRWKFAGPLNVD